ncbi:citrate lyase subunit beta-like protein [Entomortierella parvispora]|uniref:Citrate lyase subunit beta-like protein n=1 Tax=Entomortierella parvispora TaxID=205924 RepID=A0A9P3H5V1_9FUNG|nr:citrate lyase subunit beta-like protein [Entomortierella parvispora]
MLAALRTSVAHGTFRRAHGTAMVCTQSAMTAFRSTRHLSTSFPVPANDTNSGSSVSASSPGSPLASGGVGGGAAGIGGVDGLNAIEPEKRIRRSIFYVPGSDERKLKSSLSLAADCLVYDLEDGVAHNRKNIAREMVFDALEASEHRKAEKAVRINAVGSGLEFDDLNVVLRSSRLQAIVIPKVQSAKDIQFVSQMVDSVAPFITRKNVRIIASIESALGVMNLKEIATADPRVDALVFAAEDYCADLGLTRTREGMEMLYGRSAIVTAAHAYGLQAIDLVCMDYKNDDILKEECEFGRRMGFLGKQAVHPRQLEIIQRCFLPTDHEIARAADISEGYQEHSKRGVGAFNYNGKVIDLPVVKWAEKIISRARQGGVAIPSAEERQRILKLGPTGVATVEGGVAPKKDNAAAAA